MAVLVRAARLSDLEAVMALDPSRGPFVRGWIEAGHAYVATEGADPLGLAVMTRRFFDRALIELMVVVGGRRRRGVGAAILRHLEAASPTATLWTSTNEKNASTRALVRAAGFTLSGRVEGLDDGVPELFFRKLVR